MAGDDKQLQRLGKWAFWRVNRKSFREDYEEDDQGLDRGSLTSAAVVLVLLAIGIAIMVVLASRG